MTPDAVFPNNAGIVNGETYEYFFGTSGGKLV
jgi:hypothetical protein